MPPERRQRIRDLRGELLAGAGNVLPKVKAGKIRTPAARPALVGHVLDACGTLVTGTGEYLVHALTRDAERTGKLGLVGARLVRGEQGAAEVAPGLVEALKRVERLLVGAEHSLDFGVVCHASTIAGKGTLHLLRKGYLHLRTNPAILSAPV